MMKVKMLKENQDFDPKRIFASVYSREKPSCGSNCLFFEKEDQPKHLSFKEVTHLQQRLMRYIHKMGWRFELKSTFAHLNKELNRCAHVACSMGPLPEMWPIEEEQFFSVTNLLEK